MRGGIETGWGWSKDRAPASTRCQVHGCCRGSGVGGGGDERGRKKRKKKKKGKTLSSAFSLKYTRALMPRRSRPNECGFWKARVAHLAVAAHKGLWRNGRRIRPRVLPPTSMSSA